MNDPIDRGHNNPPELLPVLPPEDGIDTAAVEASMLKYEEETAFDAKRVAEFMGKVRLFADACGKWKDVSVIERKDQAERLTDFMGGLGKLTKYGDAARKEEKKPYLDKGAAVDRAWNEGLEILERCASDLKPKQTAWLKAESERIEREKAEAARIAAEKAAEAEELRLAAIARNDVAGEVQAEAAAKAAQKDIKAAARPVSAKAGSATGAGRTMALRTVRTAEIHNPNGVYMHFREHPEVIELLQRLATAAIRAGIEFDPKILTIKEEKVAA